MTDAYTTQLIDLGDEGPDSNSNSNSTSVGATAGFNNFDTLLFPQTQPVPTATSGASSSILTEHTPQSRSYTEQLLDTSPVSPMSPMKAAVTRTGSIPLDTPSPSVAVNGDAAATLAATTSKGIAIGNTDFFDFFGPSSGQSPSGNGVLAGSFSNTFTSSYGLEAASQAVPIVRAASPEPPMQDSLALLEGRAFPTAAAAAASPQASGITFAAPVPATADDVLIQIVPQEKSHLTQEEKCDLETLKSYLMTFKANSDKNAHYLKSKSKL